MSFSQVQWRLSLWPAVPTSTSAPTPTSASQGAGGATASPTASTNPTRSPARLCCPALSLLRMAAPLDSTAVWMPSACLPYCAVMESRTVPTEKMRTDAVSSVCVVWNKHLVQFSLLALMVKENQCCQTLAFTLCSLFLLLFSMSMCTTFCHYLPLVFFYNPIKTHIMKDTPQVLSSSCKRQLSYSTCRLLMF